MPTDPRRRLLASLLADGDGGRARVEGLHGAEPLLLPAGKSLPPTAYSKVFIGESATANKGPGFGPLTHPAVVAVSRISMPGSTPC